MSYFPAGKSMARRVHGERSVGLLYGQRALLIGALEPLTYTGTMLSTKAGEWPFKRLVRTAKAQEAIFLGTKEEADRILARVHNQHLRITGTLPATYPEFASWFAEKLASPDLHATPHALAFAPVVAFDHPVPRGARFNLAAQNLIIKGTLPPRVREIFDIPWGAGLS